MYPWLFECWDCGRVGDVDVDNEMIADVKNTLQSTMREEEGWGGEIRRGQR
jgi:hypothetical protein